MAMDKTSGNDDDDGASSGVASLSVSFRLRFNTANDADDAAKSGTTVVGVVLVGSIDSLWTCRFCFTGSFLTIVVVVVEVFALFRFLQDRRVALVVVVVVAAGAMVQVGVLTDC